MKIVFYSAKTYEKKYFSEFNDENCDLVFLSDALNTETVFLSAGTEAICCFVCDDLNAKVLTQLAEQGTHLILLRSAGYDHVDIKTASHLNMTILRVPSYSPQAIAEFTVALLLSLSRKLLLAEHQLKKLDFRLDNLLGFNLYQKTVGVIGTGKIGTAFSKIMRGFSCEILAYDPFPNDECKHLGVQYTSLSDVLVFSDVVSLHCLLNDETRHIINSSALDKMKSTAMLINTGRGALIDTQALISALNNGEISCAGLDVYEYEKPIFFKKHHGDQFNDSLLVELLKMPNVLITPHQAFLTHEAIANIAKQVFANCIAYQTKEFQKETIVLMGE